MLTSARVKSLLGVGWGEGRKLSKIGKEEPGKGGVS